MPFPRSAGVILHPTSLPGGHGVGDLGDSAHRFVEFLSAAGLGLWQVLPLGPTGAANSPYQCLSSFAGNPLLVSLDELARQGLLTAADLAAAPAPGPRVDFAFAAAFKERLLRKAFAAFATADPGRKARFAAFRREQAGWLDDFTLFVACKQAFDGRAWFDWPDADLAARKPAALARARKDLADEISFVAFCQFCFFTQWRTLKEAANARGIELIGDVPIYTAHDSADVWAARELFELDAKGAATRMAGVPPDYFCATGQLWGNPIYRWDELRKTGYAWWIHRISATLGLVDRLRIDHFRAFEAYWEVPAGEKTAVNGKWIPGPGDDFFEKLRDALGDLPIIAEDLGVITPEVDGLRQRHGLPGMKVLQFAFCEGAEHYLPHTYETNCVAYTATHDNDTSRGWYAASGPDYAHHDPETNARERDKARRYLARDGSDIAWDLIRLALASVADTAIVPMQDLLDLGNDCRLNRPGTPDGQWEWRLTGGQLDGAPADRMRELVWLYGRAPRPSGAAAR